MIVWQRLKRRELRAPHFLHPAGRRLDLLPVYVPFRTTLRP